MKTYEKIVTAIITCAFSALIFAAATFFAVNYNGWFADTEASQNNAVSFSDTHGNKVLLNMRQTTVGEGISDDTLREMNIYGFPVGESPYYIYVEKGGHTLSVFEKDEFGLYTRRVFTWSTATGKTNMLTPVGNFSVGDKEEWHVWPSGSVSPYATKYYDAKNHYGGLFIHGPIYRDTYFSSIFGNTARQIGTNCSSGCLRTETEAAYFVYKMCAEGTVIRIVDGSPLGFTPDREVTVYNQSIEPDLERFLNPSKEIEKIEFAESSHTMSVGDQYVPVVVVTPEEPDYLPLEWTTNNPAIIKIMGNCIWAVGTGHAIVSATTKDNVLTASLNINVVVHDVDTTQAPPDVDVEMQEDNSAVTDDYQPISQDLLFLKINGKRFYINQDVRSLLNCLGSKYYQKPSAQSCAYNGLDRFFVYSYKYNGSCSISTVPMLADGEDAICEIEFVNYTDADLESSKGIRLGDSFEAVKNAYGEFYTQVSVVDNQNPEDSFIRITYWAGTANDPGTPSLYFTLNPETNTVKGMGIYSARNMG